MVELGVDLGPIRGFAPGRPADGAKLPDQIGHQVVAHQDRVVEREVACPDGGNAGLGVQDQDLAGDPVFLEMRSGSGKPARKATARSSKQRWKVMQRTPDVRQHLSAYASPSETANTPKAGDRPQGRAASRPSARGGVANPCGHPLRHAVKKRAACAAPGSVGSVCADPAAPISNGDHRHRNHHRIRRCAGRGVPSGGRC